MDDNWRKGQNCNSICAALILQRLWRRPARLGGHKTVPPQHRRKRQLVIELGSETTEWRIEVKCVAHAGRADLGMCLIKACSGGVQKGD